MAVPPDAGRPDAERPESAFSWPAPVFSFLAEGGGEPPVPATDSVAQTGSTPVTECLKAVKTAISCNIEKTMPVETRTLPGRINPLPEPTGSITEAQWKCHSKKPAKTAQAALTADLAELPSLWPHLTDAGRRAVAGDGGPAQEKSLVERNGFGLKHPGK
jgi:hypothetical protein